VFFVVNSLTCEIYKKKIIKKSKKNLAVIIIIHKLPPHYDDEVKTDTAPICFVTISIFPAPGAAFSQLQKTEKKY
jgi:hypothetical protein